MKNKIPKHLRKYNWYGPHLAYLGYRVPFDAIAASLGGVDLSGADLSGVDLRHSDIGCATEFDEG